MTEGGEIINSLVNFARLLISEKDTAEMLLPATSDARLVTAQLPASRVLYGSIPISTLLLP